MPAHVSGASANDPTIDLQVTCVFCGAVSVVTMRLASYLAWDAGELIQYAAPDLDPDLREQLISGTCPACWDAMEESLNDRNDDQSLPDRNGCPGGAG